MVYEVAYNLRMPLYKLMNEMPHEELVGWFAYFESRPVGWRDDLRTSYLMQAQGSKQKSTEIFPSLRQVLRKNHSSPAESLKGSFMMSKMLSAVGGDKLEFLHGNENERG